MVNVDGAVQARGVGSITMGPPVTEAPFNLKMQVVRLMA